jgi:hypothetical protein
MNFHYKEALFSTPFWDFLNERHAIYLRKQAGITPLTEDPILAEWRFTNVFRELDRETIWVRENIREPYADHPNLWFMLAVARYINWSPTHQAVMDAGAWPTTDEWRPEQLAEVLQARTDAKEKVYTGAYMVHVENNKRAPWYTWPKPRQIAEVFLGRLWNDRRRWEAFFSEQRSLRDTWLRFHPYTGWGGDGFTAYEVVSDLRHTRYLRGADDIMTWANAGPGAQRGLNRLLGRDLKAPVKDRSVTLMRALLAEQDQFRGEHVPPLEMRDIEHTLCEFDKYARVKNGEGKLRSRY